MAEQREQDVMYPTVTGIPEVWSSVGEVFSQIGRDVVSSVGTIAGKFELRRNPRSLDDNDERRSRTAETTALPEVSSSMRSLGLRQTEPMQSDYSAPTQEELQNIYRDLFQRQYEQAVMEQQERVYTSIPLGYAPFMYETVYERDLTGRDIPIGYRLKEWYRTPLEQTAHRLATQDPDIARRQLQDPYMRGLSTAQGRAAYEQTVSEALSPDYEAPSRFVEPSTLVTEEDAVRIVAMMDVNQLNQLKNNLIRVGMLDPNKAGNPLFADRTQETYIAFAELVGLAQQNARTWDTFLGEALARNINFGRAGTSGSDRPQALVRLSSPDDLGAVFGQTALRTIGRQLTDEEKQMMVTTYQNMERTYWRQAAGGGEIVEPPSAQAFAETNIPENLGQEYDVFQMGNTLDSFRQILGGQL